MARITRSSTVPSPTPASNTRSAGGRGCTLASSMATRLATTHFSLQVLTKSRYFCRLSKKRKLRCGSRAPGGAGAMESVLGGGSGARSISPGRGGGAPLLACMKARMRSSGSVGGQGGGLDRPGRGRGRAFVGLHEGADGVERVGGDAPAVAQPRRELAVVDRAAAEGRLRQPGVTAIIGDLLQQVLCAHGQP